MVLYLKAESDIPDLVIDFIEVKLKSGQIISLTWDESEFDREDGQFEARYKGVYFDDEYGNGRLSELKGMKIQHIELYSECEDVSSFKLRELSFHDGEGSLVFSYPKCQTERSSNGEATETTNSTIERRFCSMRANQKEVTQSMRKLIAELTEADIAYYKHDDPVMTDREYDRKLDQLRSLEEESGIILSGSQTQKVSGEILEELVSVRHTKPMLSAGKTKSIDELVKFAGGRDVVLSWKMDGLTLVLRYENGVLQQAITRGREGIIGEDVTHTVRKFDNVPLAIPVKDAIEVRGEGVISWENFEKINLSLEEPYGHPRNLASGSTRKLNAAEAGKRHLEFAAFELVTDMKMDTKAEQLAFMEQLGFLVVPYVQIPLADDAAIRQAVAKMKPEEFAYPVDGLILEQDDIAYGRSLGSTGHHENRMMALKWEDELYETKFLGLETAVTRNGMVSLTGIFEPVEIGGTEVSRAYLHNLDIFEKLSLGQGDTIQVYKANMIIPQIAENQTKSGTVDIPSSCPCCGSRLQIHETSGGTRQLFCENPNYSILSQNLFCRPSAVMKYTVTILRYSCTYQEELLLNPLDLFRLAKELGITMEQWMEQYGECYIGEDSRMPIVRIRPQGETRRCPWLKNNKCSVHKAKPSVCGLYPLGRSVRYAQDEQGNPDMEKSKVMYFHSGCFCGSQNGHQTVREWLEEFHLLESESFFLQWSYVHMETSQFLRRLEKMVTNKDIMDMAWNMVFGLLYARYDTEKEFQPQFEQNVKQLKEHITTIESMGGVAS